MNLLNIKTNDEGQALIEYMLILIFVVTLGAKVSKSFGGFMGDSFANIGHVLTLNLRVGICEKQCLYPRFYNGGE